MVLCYNLSHYRIRKLVTVGDLVNREKEAPFFTAIPSLIMTVRSRCVDIKWEQKFENF